jgi:hypothetical protein
MNEMRIRMKMTNTRWLHFCLPLLLLTCSFAAVGGNKPNVVGKWQLSWEARIGTERGTLLLEQVDSRLTGTYQGGLSSPHVSGSTDGTNITLNLDFPGTHPFTIAFKGTVDGDKMAGKFEIEGLANGYDSHGENVRPSNYSWTAVRQPSSTQSNSAQNQPSPGDSARP